MRHGARRNLVPCREGKTPIASGPTTSFSRGTSSVPVDQAAQCPIRSGPGGQSPPSALAVCIEALPSARTFFCNG